MKAIAIVKRGVADKLYRGGNLYALDIVAIRESPVVYTNHARTVGRIFGNNYIGLVVEVANSGNNARAVFIIRGILKAGLEIALERAHRYLGILVAEHYKVRNSLPRAALHKTDLAVINVAISYIGVEVSVITGYVATVSQATRSVNLLVFDRIGTACKREPHSVGKLY